MAEEIVLPVRLRISLCLGWVHVPVSIEHLRLIVFQKIDTCLYALNGLADGWNFVSVDKKVDHQLSLHDLLQQSLLYLVHWQFQVK